MRRSSFTELDAALKQKNVRLLMALFRRSLATQIVMTDRSSRCVSVFVSAAVKTFWEIK